MVSGPLILTTISQGVSKYCLQYAERRWRLIVLVLSVGFIIIIIILQQFDGVNALQSPIFIRSSLYFSEHSLMDYPG